MTRGASDNISKLEKETGIAFREENLILEALTHRSYLNEHPEWPLPHNERLEYLGDAVLELAVSEKLFRAFPDYPEGKLTVLRAALVNYQMLARVATRLKLENYLLLSRGERSDSAKAKEVILANACEAVVGAIYLDGGFAAADGFTERFVMPYLEEILKTGSYRDAKSELQERIQEKLRVTPTYRVIREDGPAHERVFHIGVYFDDELIAEGSGSSKQEAETQAARNALAKYK